MMLLYKFKNQLCTADGSPCLHSTQAMIDALGGESNSLEYQVMVLWLKRRPKLIHDYSLAGYILAPHRKIMQDASVRMRESTIYTDAVSRLIGKLLVDDDTNNRLRLIGNLVAANGGTNNRLALSRTEQIAQSTIVFLREHRNFANRTGTYDNTIMWSEPDNDEFIVSCHWHLTWTVPRSTVLGKLACLVLSKILGIGSAERNWKQVKKLKSGDRSNLSMNVTSKITNVYGQYQRMKASSRQEQMSSVGKLWTEEDFHCMKLDVFCGDIAASLENDARMATMRIFRNWNERWQNPPHGLGPRGDDFLEERLRTKFLGMKLLWNTNLFWIHSVALRKKRADNKYVLIAINESFE
jgi:hypothetical protein